MAFFGAIFNAVRGVIESVKFRFGLGEMYKLINKYKRKDAYINDFAGIDRVDAQNNLIIAEYLIERRNIKQDLGFSNNINALWRRTRITMNTKLKEIESNLNSEYATKLDIAKLITALSQVAGEVDKELIANKGQMKEFTTRAAADLEVRVEKLRRELLSASYKEDIRRLRTGVVFALLPLYAGLIYIIFTLK